MKTRRCNPPGPRLRAPAAADRRHRAAARRSRPLGIGVVPRRGAWPAAGEGGGPWLGWRTTPSLRPGDASTAQGSRSAAQRLASALARCANRGRPGGVIASTQGPHSRAGPAKQYAALDSYLAATNAPIENTENYCPASVLRCACYLRSRRFSGCPAIHRLRTRRSESKSTLNYGASWATLGMTAKFPQQAVTRVANAPPVVICLPAAPHWCCQTGGDTSRVRLNRPVGRGALGLSAMKRPRGLYLPGPPLAGLHL